MQLNLILMEMEKLTWSLALQVGDVKSKLQNIFAELGLGDFINPVKADYSASMADVVAKYKNGKPVLFYTWTPNWTVGALQLGKDVVWIEVHSATKKVKVANATKSKINMGFGADDIRPAANKDFLKQILM